MNEIANTTQAELSVLDNLATQAQMFSCGAAMNLLQLGRVLTEARPLVPQGQWIEWVQTNAHLPERRAQEYMQAYRKFGIDQRIAQLGPSQIIALLPMTDEERDRLMAENDVGGMTNRELKEAIRAQRETLRAEAMAEAQGAIAQAEADRDAAIRRASELETKGPEIPPELTDELNKNRAEIARLHSGAGGYSAGAAGGHEPHPGGAFEPEKRTGKGRRGKADRRRTDHRRVLPSREGVYGAGGPYALYAKHLREYAAGRKTAIRGAAAHGGGLDGRREAGAQQLLCGGRDHR